MNIRKKGANAELELAKVIMTGLRDHHGIEVDMTRNLEQVRSGGHDLNGLPHFSIEVKRQEKLSINTWWAQACTQAEELGRVPVLAYRQNFKDWNFVLPLASINSMFNDEAEKYSGNHRMTIDLDSFLLMAALNTQSLINEVQQQQRMETAH